MYKARLNFHRCLWLREWQILALWLQRKVEDTTKEKQKKKKQWELKVPEQVVSPHQLAAGSSSQA